VLFSCARCLLHLSATPLTLTLSLSLSSLTLTLTHPAKERLSVMLVHQRNSDVFQAIDMEALRKEVAGVIKKYIKVAEEKNASKMTIKQEGEFDFLEMHFQLDKNLYPGTVPGKLAGMTAAAGKK